MVHKICKNCLKTCKQEDTVKIVKCPRFQKRLSNDEFKNLVDSLEEIQTDADSVKKRTQELIRKIQDENNECIHGDTDIRDTTITT